jgi:hypothetical protein
MQIWNTEHAASVHCMKQCYVDSNTINIIYSDPHFVGCEWSASCTCCYTPRGRSLGTHGIGDWVSPRAGLDSVWEVKILGPIGIRTLTPWSSSPYPVATLTGYHGSVVQFIGITYRTQAVRRPSARECWCPPREFPTGFGKAFRWSNCLSTGQHYVAYEDILCDGMFVCGYNVKMRVAGTLHTRYTGHVRDVLHSALALQFYFLLLIPSCLLFDWRCRWHIRLKGWLTFRCAKHIPEDWTLHNHHWRTSNIGPTYQSLPLVHMYQ